MIVDATFLKKAQRWSFQQLAQECGVPFLIVDFDITEAALLARIERRQTFQKDASEADASVLQQQIQAAEPLTAEENAWVMNADRSMDDMLVMLEKQHRT